ncbi:ankyrin repeat-containing domain protein [Pelagophyceae sp. CCMP2097]|nr:ankyrin repeat-containing domain protein [Pelagophyceae sp. CCMP2097]
MRGVWADSLTQPPAKLHEFTDEEAAELKQIFLRVDLDHSGALDKGELLGALAVWGVAAAICDADVVGLIARFDADRSGNLDLDEFMMLASVALAKQGGDDERVETTLRAHFARETARIRSANVRTQLAVDAATIRFFREEAACAASGADNSHVTIARAARHANEAAHALGGDAPACGKAAEHMRCRATAELNVKLQDAAAHGAAADALLRLLLRGAEIDARSCEPPHGTALMLALDARHAGAARLLLSRGADAGLCDDDGATPLHVAISSGCARKDAALLDAILARADASPPPTPAPPPCDARLAATGEAPLHLAALRGLDHQVAWLISHGADVDAVNVRGCTPLMLAAQAGSVACCRQLVAAGGDVNRLDEANCTARDRADAADHTAVAALLRENGAVSGSQAVKFLVGEGRENPRTLSARRRVTKSLDYKPEGWAQGSPAATPTKTFPRLSPITASPITAARSLSALAVES